MIGRLRGEEFLILTAGADTDRADLAPQSDRERTWQPFLTRNGEVTVGDNPSELIAQAVRSMYEVKTTSRTHHHRTPRRPILQTKA